MPTSTKPESVNIVTGQSLNGIIQYLERIPHSIFEESQTAVRTRILFSYSRVEVFDNLLCWQYMATSFHSLTAILSLLI